MSFTERAQACTGRRWRWLLLGAAGLCWGGPASAQSCPDTHAACDNGGCCLSSDQCCPTLAEGCCGSLTPYCCGDGTCAASPSQCGDPGAAECQGYDIPCGGGCAPAGADCCDDEGHYCPPESMCGSATTCLAGDEALAASLVAPPSPISGPSEPRALSPAADPSNASGRSCALSSGPAPRPASTETARFGILLLAALLGARRRRAESLFERGERS